MKILCCFSFLFVLSWAAAAQDIEIHLDPAITKHEPVYSFTPTEDGQQGYYLWVWKPSVESNMPILGYGFPQNHPMNINPLREGEALPEIRLPELIIPDSMDKQGKEKQQEGRKDSGKQPNPRR